VKAILRQLSVSVLAIVALAESVMLLRAGWWSAFSSRVAVLSDFMLKVVHELAPLAWPVVAVYLSYRFQPQLVQLSQRLRKGPGGIDFADPDTLERLQEPSLPTPDATPVKPTVPVPQEAQQPLSTGQVSLASSAATASSTEMAHIQQSESRERIYSEIVSETEDLAPELAVTALSIQIERKLKRLAGIVGTYPRDNPTFRSLLKALETTLPREVSEVALAFSSVRNAVVHGQRVPESSVLNTIEAGRSLLKYLSERPEKPFVVVASGLIPYENKEATIVRQGFTVLLLRNDETEQAFPTTRTYAPGTEVSWEWNMGPTYPETFFEHPTTGAIGEAWSQSAEFVGRPIDEL
jgi:hypothetical protein